MGMGPAQGQQFIPPCGYSQFVPFNAVIVGALIGAVTSAHCVRCCCVTATLLCSEGLTADVCFRLIQSSQLANPQRNYGGLLKWIKSASVEISRGWVALSGQSGLKLLPACRAVIVLYKHVRSTLSRAWLCVIRNREHTLVSELHMLFNFPHKEIPRECAFTQLVGLQPKLYFNISVLVAEGVIADVLGPS